MNKRIKKKLTKRFGFHKYSDGELYVRFLDVIHKDKLTQIYTFNTKNEACMFIKTCKSFGTNATYFGNISNAVIGEDVPKALFGVSIL